MPKKLIQDVVPPDNKRSVRNIPVPVRVTRGTDTKQNAEITPPINTVINAQTAKVTKSKSKPILEETPINNTTEETITKIPAISSSSSGKRNFHKPIYWSIVTSVFAIFVYLIYMFLNVGAVITITPKERLAILSNEFSAKKNPQPNELSFEVIELEEQLSKTVPTTGEKNVEKKATGRVILYNDFSRASQRIIKNTRLETADGKIYRIDGSIVIPGQTTSGGKVVPGSVEVIVTADSAGEEYNIGLVDFTIPGFKDEPAKYAKFYARSKTTMTGGFKGVIKTASQADREVATKEVTATLKEKLIQKAKEQVPQDFVLFDKSSYFTIESLSPPESNEVKIKATIHGIIFNRSKLSSSIAKAVLPQYEPNEEVNISNFDDLEFRPDSLEVAPWQTGNLPFTLVGTTSIRWIIDENKLKQELVGLPKSSAENVFASFKGIDVAKVTITPAWKSTFPETTDKIKTIIEESADNNEKTP